MRWTPPQEAFYLDQHPRKSFRAGNQIGKSFGGIRWIQDIALGVHPHQFRPPPLECWIVCTSWSQSVAIMTKFRELMPECEVDHDASSSFNARNAYGKDNPAVILNNGSVFRFRTTRQGPTALQGATVNAVLIDEPSSLEIYRELDRRLTRTGGQLGMTFTPANVDCRWIREITEAGIIHETHAKLTVENLTPIGSHEPFRLATGASMNQAWVDSQWRNTPAVFAAVVLDGEWEGKPIGQFFTNFDRSVHVSSARTLSPARGPVKIVLGVDHATAARGGQVAILARYQSYADAEGRVREAIVVIDECVMEGTATAETFGNGVANMLRRHGLAWRDLHRAWGDNPAQNRYLSKSNAQLELAIARCFGFPVRTMRPRIANAEEGRGASGQLDSGCRYLYEALGDELLVIHPRCSHLIESFETWDFGAMHPGKDAIDALRYALREAVFPLHTGHGISVRLG